jgi:hypothetical protein
MSSDQKISKISLIVLPVLIGLAGLFLIKQMYPLHINSHTGFGQDPAYQYLFAGVDILLGNAPVHTDHPGTPLQTLIAGLLLVTWLLLRSFGVSTFGLFESVLRMPEYFLMATSVSLLALTCIALYNFGAQTWRLTRNTPLALSCQLTPLLFPVVIPNIIFPTPEALLISISSALMAVIAPLALSTGPIPEQRLKSIAMWSGILCGVGVAVKITFLPCLCLLLLLRHPRLILKAVLISSIAWFVGVLPILPRLGGMFQWFFNLLTHSGIHGRGTQTILEWAQLKLAIGWLVNHFWHFYVITAALVIFVIVLVAIKLIAYFRHKLQIAKLTNDFLITHLETSNDKIYIAFVFLLAACAQSLMVAKHLGPSYMVPALSLPSLALVWLTQQVKTSNNAPRMRQAAYWGWLILIIFVASVSLAKSLKTVTDDHKRGLASHDQIVNEIQKFTNPIILGTFNCNFLNCARWFGMSLVPEMGRRMSAVDANFLYFDIFSKKINSPGAGELSHEQTAATVLKFVTENRPLLLIAPPYPQLDALETQLILSTPVQNLYLVTGVRQKY